MPEAEQPKSAQRPEEALNWRLDYAKYLLTQTVEPFEKIAANCGWTSETAFAHVFREQVGVTPAHYRRWHQT